MTAIVSDDHELDRVTLAEILRRRLGFTQVIETASLDEALERLNDTQQVRFALFDLVMPGMASAASLRAVREVFPQVRVVVVTGSTKREDMLQALDAGVHGYIPKSLGLEEIAKALSAVIGGSVYIPWSITELPPAVPQDAPPLLPSADAQSLGLTPRQKDVLLLLREGKSNKEIARSLGLGPGTIKIHVAAVLRTLGVPNRTAAASAASGLLDRRQSPQR